MIPIRDTVVSRTPPLVVFALIGLNAGVFYAEAALPPQTTAALIERFALVPARLFGHDAAAGPVAGPAWGALGLVTSQFLHAGLLHVLGNLWSLWIFGDNVEDRMGKRRFLAFYLTCGVVAGAVHATLAPTSTTPTLGASGAIAGVMGAYLIWFPFARIILLVPVIFYPLFVEVPAFVFLGLWFLLQYLGGLGAGGPAGAQEVAFWAHVGGFLAGIALCGPFLVLFRRRRPRSAFADEEGFESAWRPW